MKNPYLPKKAKILNITNETEDIKTFRINYKTKHDPGQFIEIGIFGIGECPVSLSSYSNKYIDLCIRDVGNVTHNIHRLKKGDNVFVRGPYGHGYPMEEIKGKNILIIGGGTGTAPMRSVIDHIEKNRKNFRDIQIFLGFRSPKDILFKKDVKRWSKNFNFNITVDKADRKWKGHVGVITKLLEKAELNKDSIVIACGPPIMIKFVIETLNKKGFNDEQIYVSFERLMHCGIGKCGHCMVDRYYTCKDGPVFRYDLIRGVQD